MQAPSSQVFQKEEKSETTERVLQQKHVHANNKINKYIRESKIIIIKYKKPKKNVLRKKCLKGIHLARPNWSMAFAEFALVFLISLLYFLLLLLALNVSLKKSIS